jgi:hypothetical protein
MLFNINLFQKKSNNNVVILDSYLMDNIKAEFKKDNGSYMIYLSKIGKFGLIKEIFSKTYKTKEIAELCFFNLIKRLNNDPFYIQNLCSASQKQ